MRGVGELEFESVLTLIEVLLALHFANRFTFDHIQFRRLMRHIISQFICRALLANEISINKVLSKLAREPKHEDKHNERLRDALEVSILGMIILLTRASLCLGLRSLAHCWTYWFLDALVTSPHSWYSRGLIWFAESSALSCVEYRNCSFLLAEGPEFSYLS